MAYIRVQRKGSRRTRTIDLTGRKSIQIGRSSSSDLPLKDRAVSRHHCVIERNDSGAWIIRDLDSRHAFKVNHVPQRRAELVDGDLVRIGMYEITFHTRSEVPLDDASPSSDDSGSSEIAFDTDHGAHDEPQRLESELAEATSALAASEREVAALKRDLQRVCELNAEREQELKAAHAAEVELRARERDELRRELDHAREELKAEQSSSTAHDLNLSTLQRERDDLARRLAETEATAQAGWEELETEAIALRESAAAAEAARASLEAEVNALRAAIDEKSVQSESAMDAAAHEQHARELEQRLEFLEEELRAARAGRVAAEHERSEFERSIAEIVADRDHRTSELESVRTDLESAREEVRRLHEAAENAAATRSVEQAEETQRLRDRCTELEGRLREATDRLELIEVQLTSTREERDRATERRDAAEDECARLREQAAELEQTVSNRRLTEEAALRDEVAEELREINALRATIESRLDGLHQELLAREERIAELVAELETARIEADRLAQDHESDEAQRASLQEEAAGLRAQIEDHRAQGEEAAARIAALEQEIDSLRSAESAAVSELREQLIEARSAATEASARQERTTAQLHETEAQLEQVRVELREAGHALEAARQQAEHAAQEAARRAAEPVEDTVQPRVDDDLRSRYEQALRRMANAEQNLAAYKVKFKELATDREKLLTRMKILTAQLERTRRELQAARTSAEKREAALTRYIRQIHSDGAIEASIVELTPEEILRAQAAGAMIVEVDDDR